MSLLNNALGRRAFLASAVAAGAATAFAAHGVEPSPIVETSAGKLRGLTVAGVHNFKGVRYGDTTEGRRFQPPRPPEPWSGLREATTYGGQSPQPVRPDYKLYSSWSNWRAASEDCLFLNIWTRGLNDDARRPVMVWLHGGGFTTGTGNALNYDGQRLVARRDVVLVTVTHRLNVFGYLPLGPLLGPDFADAGNVGTLDILQALHWVRDNIAAFGGDPDNVMIFGESGGGWKTTTLMAMPLASGLFHKASVQSAPRLNAPTVEAAQPGVERFLRALDLSRSRADELRRMPTAQLVDAFVRAGSLAGVGQGPVIDGRSLPHHPLDAAALDLSADIPTLIGSTATETTVLEGVADPSLFQLNWEALPGRLGRAMAAMAPDVDPEEVLAFYRGRHPSYSAPDVYWAATSEARIRRHAIRHAELRAGLGRAPVRMWRLDWRTPIDGGKWGAPHGLDVIMHMDTVHNSASMVGAGARQANRVADQMSAAWTAFARKGSPDAPEVPAWPAYDAQRRATMLFDLESHVVDDPDSEARRLFA